MSSHHNRRATFLELVLDGRQAPSSFPEALAAARTDAKGRTVESLIGLTAAEIAQAEASLPALRYVLHARRFQLPAPTGLTSLDAVRALALQLAAEECDPFELADIDDWTARRIAAAAASGGPREAAHA